jgi:predicted AAA+ superfamily ATPase
VTADKAKLAYIFLNNYTKLYEKKYNIKPNINKYKEKWAAVSIIEDYQLDQIDKALEYYFTLQKEGHPLAWFYNNVDTIISTLKEKERDERLRLERRKETAKLRKEYLNGNA